MSLFLSQNLYVVAGYLSSINSLKSVLTQIAAAIGGLIIIYGGIKFALAFQKLDQQGEHQAVFTIVAGGVLLGLSGIVGLLGGS
ncbi:hypothetical protein [Pseudobutyrivibrio sp.]|jgi:hypothetical protein|uniref:hypothetical protein n=1 Tax=Pseudobutyrivibrio sp. TaxID=2014367 RepID=UPI0025F9642A|nr:hypothetical protein [Pseudobutyrivibrio sp.]MBE5904825.1 hypothetical protein [Pseudobutyrivibrio sp.]